MADTLDPLPLTDEDRQSIVSRLGRGALSGLAYFGGLVDKFTLGRAVRGILGGHPREALSFIPGSDVFHLTDPDQYTSGRQLLQNMGFVGEPQEGEGWLPTLGGIATEIALSPATWLTPGMGPWTKAVGPAGRVAEDSALLEHAIETGQRAASAATQKVVQDSAAGLGRDYFRAVGPREALISATLQKTVDALPEAARPEALKAIGRAAAGRGIPVTPELMNQPLGGLLEYGLPFQHGWGAGGVLGQGDTSKLIARGLDNAAEFLHGNIPGTSIAPMRRIRQAIDGGVQDTYSREAQRRMPYAAAQKYGETQKATQQIYDVADRLFDGSALGLTPEQLATMTSDQIAQAHIDYARNMRRAAGLPKYVRDATPYGPDILRMEPGWNENFQRIQAQGRNINTHENYFPRALAGWKSPTQQANSLIDELVLQPTAVSEAGLMGRAKYIDMLNGGDYEMENLYQHPFFNDQPRSSEETYKFLFPKDQPRDTHLARWTDEIPSEELTGDKLAKHLSDIEKRRKALAEFLAARNQNRIDYNLAEKLPVGDYSQTPLWAHPVVAGLSRAEGMAKVAVNTERMLDALDEGARNVRSWAAHTPWSKVQRVLEDGTTTNELVNATPLQHAALAAKAKGYETVPMEDVWKALQLDPEKAAANYAARNGIVLPPQAEADAYAEAIAKLSETPVPKTLLDDATKTIQPFSAPESARWWTNLYDQGTRMFKVGVLSHPANKMRDYTSGQLQSIMRGQFDPEAWSAARALRQANAAAYGPFAQKLPLFQDAVEKGLYENTPEDAARWLRSFAASTGLVHPSERTMGDAMLVKTQAPLDLQEVASDIPGRKPETVMGAVLQEATDKNNTWWNPFHIKGVGLQEPYDATRFIPAAMSERATNIVDFDNRLAPLLALTKRGVAPTESIRRILSAQVNYAPRAYTGIENEYLSRAFPFYKYSRAMLGDTLQEVINHPGGALAQVIRGQTDLRDQNHFLPQHIARTMGMEVPGAPEGYQRYLTTLGLMHEDPLNAIAVGPTMYSTAREAFSDLAGRLNPVLKTPIELGTGRQLYSGRDLADLTGNLGQLAANVTGAPDAYKFNPLIEELAAASPASRLLTTLRTLTDWRKPVSIKAANLLTGLRFNDVDINKAENVAMRHALEEVLREQQGVKTYEHYYAPDDNKLTPDAQRLMQLYREMALAAQKQAKDRALRLAAAA